ncbi:hypothetical protein DOY81_003425 [Sarcophaga bullata]|nr:hypothetical protein DOY81_003425 [Sarcophaga bullata]
MNWYEGNIAEAVALSKTKNAIFVVYVEGKDEATAKLGGFINNKNIREKLESDDFVAIKIEGESEPYMQFASIYQIVPVPSIFFIGKAGTPLDITTGVINSVEELEGKIAKVLQLAGKTSSVAAASSQINDFIREETKASGSGIPAQKEEKKKSEPTEHKEEKSNETSSDDVICKDGVCYKKPQEPEPKEVNAAEDTVNKPTEEPKVAETRKYLEQKRLERLEEEKRLEKERELRRRKEGKEMQNLRNWQKDQELKELKENIKRERLEEQKARERIRAQIAADKAERAHKFAAENQAATTSSQAASSNTTKAVAPPVATASDETRLQFRLASGASNTHNFKCSTTLAEIRDYVTLQVLPGTGIKEYTLATTYPKRELTNEHNSKTLLELELFPSAVILIIGKEATGPTAIISRNGGLLNMFSIMVMTILNPIFSLLTTAKNWLTGNRNKNDGNAAQTGAQKRANEEQNIQNDVTKRRNVDRFLGGGAGNVTGSSNQNPEESSTEPNQAGAYRRYVGGSNIHRLSDNRKDSDDENATWNGNSTQQQ